MGVSVGTHIGLVDYRCSLQKKEILKDGLVRNKIRSIKHKKDELLNKIKN
jgi:hypothetical protein